MSLAIHRTAIVALLAAVPSIGVVHDEEPYARTEGAWRSLYLWTAGDGSQQLRGWFLRRVRTRETMTGVGRTVNAHTWQVRGFMALMPPDTGKTFDGLVEAFRQAVRNDPDFGGAIVPGPLDQPTGVQVTDSGPVMFCGVLCHSATLALTTYEYLDFGE